MNNLLSVIIPAYNEEFELGETFAALFELRNFIGSQQVAGINEMVDPDILEQIAGHGLAEAGHQHLPGLPAQVLQHGNIVAVAGHEDKRTDVGPSVHHF